MKTHWRHHHYVYRHTSASLCVNHHRRRICKQHHSSSVWKGLLLSLSAVWCPWLQLQQTSQWHQHYCSSLLAAGVSIWRRKVNQNAASSAYLFAALAPRWWSKIPIRPNCFSDTHTRTHTRTHTHTHTHTHTWTDCCLSKTLKLVSVCFFKDPLPSFLSSFFRHRMFSLWYSSAFTTSVTVRHTCQSHRSEQLNNGNINNWKKWCVHHSTLIKNKAIYRSHSQ